MSIRLKILCGCLALTLLAGLIGAFDTASERELGGLADRIYDQAFMSMSYLRSAQNAFAVAAGRGGAGGEAARDIAADLEVAERRAMSAQGAAAATALRVRIERLAAGTRPPAEEATGKAEAGKAEAGEAEAGEAEAVGAEFDTAVEIFASDAYRYRRQAASLVDRTVDGTRAAVAASVAVALCITWLLTRSIVPALREAVGIAGAIADGRLENVIRARGGGETARLLRALDAMQSGLADKIARINALMAEQASSHAGELAVRSARFAAALDNMSQGLSLFDAEHRLIVSNRRFAEMFGAPRVGALAAEMLAHAGLGQLAGATHGKAASAFQEVALPDGRCIAVLEQAVSQGGFVVTYEDVTDRRRSEERLAHMARHDSLTGLPNRVLFREQMEHALARARRGEATAVLCLDLDRFKEVNDTLGHPAGDALLKLAAQRLLACTRETDVVVRLGGDEFAVMRTRLEQPADAAVLARQVLAAFAEPFDVAGERLGVTTSIGVALADAANSSPDALLKSADIALYRAKAEGRATCRFFEAEMDAKLQSRREMERDLRAAVAAGELEVFYQPLVGVDGLRVEGFEALVRWRRRGRGMVSPGMVSPVMVSPGEFIPLAEEVGLIGEIGAWVLRTACAQAAGWPGEPAVAVNLSPLQFADPALAGVVAAALAASGLPARRLELEITESLLLQDDGAVLSILHEIRALGVRISMDDFGTGYSSLGYLRRFPFDKIKIDQSFVRGLTERKDCLAIVRAVIGLGGSLGMSVVAEGVETEEQLDILRAEGCRQAQGYLFSPPRPAADVPALLRRTARVPAPARAAAEAAA